MSTRLESIGDATVGAISAYLYPSDPEVRLAAVQASALAGIDYIEAIAAIMEAKPDASDADARWAVAAGLIKALATAIAAGDEPRMGFNALGQPVGPLGHPNDEEENDV